MIRLAEARLAASIMTHCSISRSLTDRPSTGLMRLQDENVGASHRLAEAGPDLPVGEVDELARANLDPQVPSDVGRPARGASAQSTSWSLCFETSSTWYLPFQAVSAHAPAG